MEVKPVLAGLLAVQRDLKAPKNQYNSFGKYKYRSCEDILSAARPLCNDNGLILLLEDEPTVVDSWHYIKATVTVVDVASGTSYSVSALARESADKKGMDSSQVTGATSSYARKYALCGMFALDDTKDTDSEEYQQRTSQRAGGSTVNDKATTNMNTPKQEAKATEGQLEALISKQKELGMSNGAIKNIIRRKFKKDSYSELNVVQKNTLVNNLEAWSQEGNE